jgi:hypothetical protein
MNIKIPEGFSDVLQIRNAAERFSEAENVANRILASGVALHPNMDHAAIFTDPPHLVAGPLKHIGYVAGWDTRSYPSPVDGCDFINVPSGLPDGHTALDRGWFRYVAVVHPVDQAGRDEMLRHGYGNPFIHHLTWGISPPEGAETSSLAGVVAAVRYMVCARDRIGAALGNTPGTLILALPAFVLENPKTRDVLSECVASLPGNSFQLEPMQGGGLLIQFFVLTGGRIEVALRLNTTQTFNPKSVHKISQDEISTHQTDA